MCQYVKAGRSTEVALQQAQAEKERMTEELAQAVEANFRYEDLVKQTQAQVNRLEELVDAQSQLLVSYRLGSHRMAKTAITRMEKAKDSLAEGDTDDTHD